MPPPLPFSRTHLPCRLCIQMADKSYILKLFFFASSHVIFVSDKHSHIASETPRISKKTEVAVVNYLEKGATPAGVAGTVFFS